MPHLAILGQCRLLTARRLGAPDVPGGGRLGADVGLYLAHVCAGLSLRGLAKASAKHPSTVLRAVRRIEARRDDPLFNAVLNDLEALVPGALDGPAMEDTALNTPRIVASCDSPDQGPAVEKEARRILRRLNEPRAFLALARGAKIACVFRKADTGFSTLARTPLPMAKAFAAREWIQCVHAGQDMARYEISAVGRAWLKRTLAEDGDARRRAAESAFAEGPTPFARQHQEEAERVLVEPEGRRKVRVNAGETPLGWLAKRKDPDGKPFLSPSEVAAGERLREDFEMAQMGPRIAQDWRRFLAPVQGGGPSDGGVASGPQGARDRLSKALTALGTGLDDAALRACCFLEGLEATERRMGWSARSGKVVLKIALGRLSDHYGFSAAKPEGVRRRAAGPATSRRNAA